MAAASIGMRRANCRAVKRYVLVLEIPETSPSDVLIPDVLIADSNKNLTAANAPVADLARRHIWRHIDAISISEHRQPQVRRESTLGAAYPHCRAGSDCSAIATHASAIAEKLWYTPTLGGAGCQEISDRNSAKGAT